MTGNLKILSRNLYLGADFLSLFPSAPADQVPFVVAKFWHLVEGTHYAERASAMAAEISERMPDVVCLQEAFRYRIISDQGQVSLELDLLELLLQELRGLGLQYEVASLAPASNVTLPTTYKDRRHVLQILDRDVILVREGLQVSQQGAGVYEAMLSMLVPHVRPDAVPMLVQRGYCWVRLQWQAQEVHIVNSHLDGVEHVQVPQARELLRSLSELQGPVFVVGDLNAEEGSQSYAAFLEAGFVDPFSDKQPTCCQAPDLRNQDTQLKTRIDHILVRGPVCTVSAEVFGTSPQERTAPHSLWPSDHAGLIAEFTPRRS